MTKRASENLTEAEQRIMEVLWSRGDGTVSEVLAAVKAPRPLAFNTVQTVLRILEEKGYVRHREEGRAFRYFPRVRRADVLRTAVGSLVRRFFASPGALAVNLLEHEELSAEELAHLRRLLAQAKNR